MSSPKYFTGVRDRPEAFVDRGQLGPFANAYWGHPAACVLPPEANLLAVAHYLEALDWQREFIKMHAVLGGKNPHLQSFLVGGMATPVDPNSQAALNTGTIAQLKKFTAAARDFVTRVYCPTCWPSLRSTRIGRRTAERWQLHVLRRIPRRRHRQATAVSAARDHPWPRFIEGRAVRSHRVAEYITHSWYSYQQGDTASLHPLQGETSPNYTGRIRPYEHLNTDSKYSWLKSPLR